MGLVRWETVAVLLGIALVGGAACADLPRASRAATASPAAAQAPPGPIAGGEGARHAAEPGEVQPEPPTLHALAVRWPVRGDANANATVATWYRRAGDGEWSQGLPLFRTHPASLSPENRVAGGWLFAGSIVDLAPDTDYEVKLSLHDPDGGGAEAALLMRTAKEPEAPAGLRVRHVVAAADGGPGGGTREDPFRGLRAAQAAAEPGDLFLLHAGVYAAGQWTIERHGVAGRPILYRGAGDGETILDGEGQERLVSAVGVQHVWFEDLTFRNARYLLVAHDGGNTVIRRSRFEVLGVGIAAVNGGYHRSRGFFITDNVFRGTTTWPRTRGLESIHAISVTGAGHVIAHNLITNVGDGIHGTRRGRLSATDIHNNDIDVCTDDGIEADQSDTNVRVFRNRITNCFAGVSFQPVNGGPVYAFRNAIYNVQYSPFKLHNDTSGVLLFHNTSVANGFPFHIDPAGETVNDVVTRNNLFLGLAGPALRSTGRMIRCDFDNDGYGWLQGPFAMWNGRIYHSLALARMSGQLYQGRGAVFVRLQGAFASGLLPPPDLRIRYPVSVNDLRLGSDSAAVDAGETLPNVSARFTGRAPDLGCCELGEPLPVYGPRPRPPA